MRGSGPGMPVRPTLPPAQISWVLLQSPRRPPERKLGSAREPRPLQSPRAATCGSVPAELRAAGGKGAGQLSKKSWLPRLRSPRTDRCGPRRPDRSAPSSACPCRPPGASSRLSSADRSSGCAAPAPPPAANHGEPRPGTCPPARPACPAPATPPAPAPRVTRDGPGEFWSSWPTPNWLHARASRFPSSAEHHHVPGPGGTQGRPCADLPTDAEVNPLVVLCAPQKIFKNKQSRPTGTSRRRRATGWSSANVCAIPT